MLPPLNALRAFEAAARHLSFKKAAEELNVTPAAVSHQIKTLEEFVGQPLFRRLTRALLLTDAGQRALPYLRDGFENLAEAAGHMQAAPDTGGLTVSVAPNFAAKWLVPRLARFHAAYPEINVRIDATNQVVDLDRDAIDLGIRYGAGGYAGMREQPLLEDVSVVPVCSPALIDGVDGETPPLKTPDDLRHHQLLHVNWGQQANSWPDWAMWLKAAGVDTGPAGIDLTRGPVFSQEQMAVEAAKAGQGVTLASSAFIGDDIAAGTLAKPFAFALPIAFCYFLVAPERTADQPKIKAFWDWAVKEAEAVG